jgi:hypothetical protein
MLLICKKDEFIRAKHDVSIVEIAGIRDSGIMCA